MFCLPTCARWCLVRVAVVCVVAIVATGTVYAAPRAECPNIVLIVVDNLGYGDLSCYGSKVHQTPQIDRLAESGMRFTDFHTNGAVCSPTRAALLTGRYQQRCGVEHAIGFTRTEGMPLATTTVAELLGPAGYTCSVFGKWHLGHVERFGPIDQGFSQSRCSNNTPDYHSHVSRVGELDWHENQQRKDEPGYLTHLVTKHTCDFIESNREQPLFVFVSHLALHFPFQGPSDPPHRTVGKTWHDTKYGPLPKSEYHRAYRDMLAAVDQSVGQIVATLERLGLRQQTLILLLSDNGAYSWVGSNGPLRGQKGELFEGGHRVPLIASWPGRIKPGTVTDATAITMDIVPTVLSLTGTRKPDDLHLDGCDLSGVLLHGDELPNRTLFWRFNNIYTDTHAHAVRQGHWKYVVEGDERLLFNLNEDLAEQHNLLDRHPAVAEQFHRAYVRWINEVTGCR